MIKNIVFDFGGVLVDWNPHYLYDGYFGSREKADWFLANICTMEWNVQMDGGKPFAQGIAELSAVHPQWSREIQMYFDRWMDMMGEEIPHMRELIQDLKRRGYRIFGLTNWSAETFCQVRHRYGIFDLLEGMTVSGEEHVTKPDQAIYRRLLERFSLVPMWQAPYKQGWRQSGSRTPPPSRNIWTPYSSEAANAAIAGRAD